MICNFYTYFGILHFRNRIKQVFSNVCSQILMFKCRTVFITVFINSRVVSGKTTHFSSVNTVFIPFHFPGWVVIPNICHHCFLFISTGTYRIKFKLIVLIFSYTFVIPVNFTSVKLVNGISARSSITSPGSLPKQC